MERHATILVVDDERLVLQCCEDVLRETGARLVLVESAEEGMAAVESNTFDLVITDLKMEGRDGLDVLRFTKERAPDVPVVILTGYPTLTSAIESVRLGAFDYVCKPVSPDELLVVVDRALENRRLSLENQYLRRETDRRGLFQDIIAQCDPMQEVLRIVRRVAPTDSTVLLVGESGVGKEVIARAIHRGSRRNDRQFVVADCATLAPSVLESELFGHVKGAFTGATVTKAGLFEVADGGTLFLDEVANIPLEIQSKLLRVLETREYKPVGAVNARRADVRLLSASNRDLRDQIKAGAFREDLFYRLNVFPISIPPLRERGEDVARLAEHFLKHFAARSNRPAPTFADDAFEALARHSWPGNVRELRNVIERIIIMTDGPLIRASDVSPEPPSTCGQGPTPACIPRTAEELNAARRATKERATAELERSFLVQALDAANGNISLAARQTGMQRTYLQSLMKRHGIRATTGTKPATD